MIKIEKTKVYGFEEAIRGARNAFDSWDKSDSYNTSTEFIVGPRDMNLLKTLIKAGDDHGKAARFLIVTADIEAPLYWWKEYDTYKVGTVADSCSTMHRIHAKEFTLDQFSTEHLISHWWSEADNFNRTVPLDVMEATIKMLNECREKYLYCVKHDPGRAKMFWWQLIQLLPSSYNQKRTLTLNYAVLKNIYEYRKDHKLDEWHEFCQMIEHLPHSELITGGKNK